MEVWFPVLRSTTTTTTGVARNSYIAPAASSAYRLWVIYYDPIYTISILQELISGASTCSQPTIGLQREVANASNMLDTSPWRKKLSRPKIVELQYLRVRYLHHGCLLMITTAHHKVTAVLLCRLDLYLTNQHQAMASSSNSKHCSPPELTKNLTSEQEAIYIEKE